MKQTGVGLSDLGYFDNLLHHDAKTRQKKHEFLMRVFDAAAVQTGVAKILTDDYATDGVADVRCPQNVQVSAGATFSCDATIDGDPVQVPEHRMSASQTELARRVIQSASDTM